MVYIFLMIKSVKIQCVVLKWIIEVSNRHTSARINKAFTDLHPLRLID